MKPLIHATLALAAGTAQAVAFDTFQGDVAYRTHFNAEPAPNVLRADGPSFVSGVTRTLEIGPALNAPGWMWFGLRRPSADSRVELLHASANGGQTLNATLSYGLDRPMNLDLSGEAAWLLHYDFAKPHKLTIYAYTDASDPAANPSVSAVTIDVPLRYQSAALVPFSAFVANDDRGAGVDWSNVDRLAFAFTAPGIGGSQLTLESISFVSAPPAPPVPEPSVAALLAAGLLAIGWRRRQNRK